MKRIPRLAKEGILTKEGWNNEIAPILDANFREIQIQPGVGVTISRGTGGQIVNASTSQGTTISQYIPWQLYNVAASGSVYSCNVWPGTVNGMVPSNITDTLYTNAVTTYFVCRIYTDGNRITSSTIFTQTTPPSPQTPGVNALPAQADFVFALFIGGIAYNVRYGINPTVSINQFITVTDVSGNTDYYYNLQIA